MVCKPLPLNGDYNRDPNKAHQSWVYIKLVREFVYLTGEKGT